MTHLRVVGEYPHDHLEHMDCEWTPDLTFECGYRYYDDDNKIQICKGVATFTGLGNTNSPPGYWLAYADYECGVCHRHSGFPTRIPIEPGSCSLVWDGHTFIPQLDIT